MKAFRSPAGYLTGQVSLYLPVLQENKCRGRDRKKSQQDDD
jgi:hypothetical protein